MDSYRLNPFTLRFQSPEREAAFRNDYFRRSKWLARGAVLLGTLQFGLFGALDALTVPSSVLEVRMVRLAVCAVLLGLVAFSLTRFFNVRTMQPLLWLVSLIAGVGVTALALVGQEPDGYQGYYVGLMLILFYVHAVLRLRFVWAAAASLSIIAVFLAGTGLFLPTTSVQMLNNAFFFFAANLLGMVVSYALEFYARHVFWQTGALRERQDQLLREDRRKSRELESARRLQLGLLPSTYPPHPIAEWVASMRPAAEVGGDYYDWSVDDDGTITLAIGDATGHGVQAGALVTATKTALACVSHEGDLAETLRRATGPIKQIGRGRLFMALALARLRGRTLELAGAGMPPALHYRAADGTLEQVPLKGMPLGGFADYPYRSTQIELEPGDTVAFMTDGLAELFDGDRQMFSYARTVEAFREVATKEPAAIIAHLEASAAAWHGRRAADDDLTFLVLRIRPDADEPLAPADADAALAAA